MDGNGLGRRSAFVSVTGSLGAAISLLGLIVLVVQVGISHGQGTVRPGVTLQPVVFVGLVGAFAAALGVSAAFLRRIWWARTGMLLLVVGAFTAHFWWLIAGTQTAGDVPLEGPESFQTTLRAIRLFSRLYPLAACALLAFVAARLMSRQVRQEFLSSRSSKA